MSAFKASDFRQCAPGASSVRAQFDSSLSSSAFTLPYPPSVNRMYRAVNGRQILSAEGRAFKARVSAMRLVPAPLVGEVDVTVRLFRPRRSGDTDNFLKSVLDVLKGIAYRDDAQVRDIFAYRRDDKHNPRVEVVVSPAAPAEESPR